MAELADSHGSGPCGSNTMRVQVSFPALDKERLLDSRYPKAFSDVRKSESKLQVIKINFCKTGFLLKFIEIAISICYI